MREISNLDLKIQLTNEYLRTGGVDKIYDANLLQDILDVKFYSDGKADPSTVTSRLNAFMLALLATHSMPPIISDENISEYSSIFQKSTCFDQETIDTVEQVDTLFENFKNNKIFLFRGQREAKWRLYSSLQRFWIWDKMKKSDADYLAILKLLIDNAKSKYETEIKNILEEINIDSINDISVLGYLQHHNCPTPLLDWTYSFETALFFGIDGLEPAQSVKEIDNYFSLYYIKEEYLSNGGMRTLLNNSLQEVGEKLKLELIAHIAVDNKQRLEMEKHFYERSFFDKKRIKGAGLISHMTKIENMLNIPISYFSDKDIDNGIAFSITNSENIKKQNGVFTWNAHFSKPLEVIGNEQFIESKLDSEPNDYRFCECFNINKNLTGYIIEKLKQLDISSLTIYPEKDIDARDIYNESKKAIS